MNGVIRLLPLCAFLACHAQGQLCPFLTDTFRGINKIKDDEIDRTVIGHGRDNKYVQNFCWKT